MGKDEKSLRKNQSCSKMGSGRCSFLLSLLQEEPLQEWMLIGGSIVAHAALRQAASFPVQLPSSRDHSRIRRRASQPCRLHLQLRHLKTRPLRKSTGTHAKG